MPSAPDPSRRMPSAAPRRVVAWVSAAAIVLAGCVTGERPTLVPDPVEVVDDPAIATVVDRLDRAESITFTASYDIIPTTTGDVTAATVTVEDGRRRIRIGEVDFITDGGRSRTCANGDASCVDFIDDARISDLNITNEFWGDAFATRLRLDGSRRVGFSEGRTEQIAGQPAVCVDIPVPGSSEPTATVTYCALDAGVLARYFGADVSIELTSFSFSADAGDIDL